MAIVGFAVLGKADRRRWLTLRLGLSNICGKLAHANRAFFLAHLYAQDSGEAGLCSPKIRSAGKCQGIEIGRLVDCLAERGKRVFISPSRLVLMRIQVEVLRNAAVSASDRCLQRKRTVSYARPSWRG